MKLAFLMLAPTFSEWRGGAPPLGPKRGWAGAFTKYRQVNTQPVVLLYINDLTRQCNIIQLLMRTCNGGTGTCSQSHGEMCDTSDVISRPISSFFTCWIREHVFSANMQGRKYLKMQEELYCPSYKKLSISKAIFLSSSLLLLRLKFIVNLILMSELKSVTREDRL